MLFPKFRLTLALALAGASLTFLAVTLNAAKNRESVVTAPPSTTDLALARNSGSELECTPPPTGMVSWWAGDNNAQDIQSNNHGSLQNGATFAPGKVAQAFSFDGVDDRVKISDSPSLQFGTDDMSVDAWIKAPPGTTFRGIVGKELQSLPFPSIILRLDDGGRLQFAVTDCGTGACGFGDSRQPVVSPFRIDDDAFHHVAGVRRSTGYELYVDGALVATRAEPARNPDSVAPIFIGIQSDSPSLQFPFTGDIDEVEIFHRALSAAEIHAIFKAGSMGKCKGVSIAGGRCDQSLWKYVYSPQRLKVVRPCITVRGAVVKTFPADDGDIHIAVKLDSRYRRLLNRFNRTEQDGNLVVELICVNQPKIRQAQLTCGTFRQKIPIPPVGSPVSITGALVTDRRVKIRGKWTHGWREIHPVTTISPF